MICTREDEVKVERPVGVRLSIPSGMGTPGFEALYVAEECQWYITQGSRELKIHSVEIKNFIKLLDKVRTEASML